MLANSNLSIHRKRRGTQKQVAHAHVASHRPSTLKTAKKQPLMRGAGGGGKQSNELGGMSAFEKWGSHAEDACDSTSKAGTLQKGRLGRVGK